MVQPEYGAFGSSRECAKCYELDTGTAGTYKEVEDDVNATYTRVEQSFLDDLFRRFNHLNASRLW